MLNVVVIYSTNTNKIVVTLPVNYRNCCFCSFFFPVREKEETNGTACKDKKVATVKDGNASKARNCPLTGAQVVQIFVQKRDLGYLGLYYLTTVDGDAYR